MATVYISEYSVSRHYGGPEEGGWWYDWCDFVRVVKVFDVDLSGAESVNGAEGLSNVRYEHPVFEACRALNDGTDNRDHYGRDRFCVNGPSDVSYHVETYPGEDQTTERPYYC